MFEKEIQFITDFNLNKIKTIGSSLTIDELIKSDVHPALVKYISGRIDLMIYEERKILLENSRFDYSGAKIADYFNQIADEIKRTRKLTFNETEEFIKKGVVFNANYSVQPKLTLINLLYRDASASKSTSEIRVYLNYLYYHDYYREIISSYISRKKVVSLSKEQFKSLVEKIDEQLLSTRKEDIISDVINSISDFYNDGGVNKFSLPAALVEAYLKEKKQEQMLEYLQKEIRDNKRKVDISELKKIIFTKPVIKEKEKPIEPDTEPEVAVEQIEVKNDNDSSLQDETEIRSEIIPDEEIKETENKKEEKNGFKEEAEINDDVKESSLEDEYKTENENIILKNEEPEPDIINKPETEEISSHDERDSDKNEDTIFEEDIIESDNQGNEIFMEELIEEDVSSGKKVTREKDILTFMHQKEIDKIVSAIFNDDEDDFINTMEKVSECSSYDQAAEILQSVFSTYQVNPYKREAVTLTNAISNYFHQGN